MPSFFKKRRIYLDFLERRPGIHERSFGVHMTLVIAALHRKELAELQAEALEAERRLAEARSPETPAALICWHGFQCMQNCCTVKGLSFWQVVNIQVQTHCQRKASTSSIPYPSIYIATNPFHPSMVAVIEHVSSMHLVESWHCFRTW